MKILHVTSDWKWTGPAEPMLQLARGLLARGHAVELACPESPDPEEPGVARHARKAGMEPVLALEPARGVRGWRDRGDVARLRALCETERFDVVHVWHTRAHALALRALFARRRGVAIVRSAPDIPPVRGWPWNRWLYGPGSDGLWCASEASARAHAGLRGGRPVSGGLGAVDRARFEGGDRARGRRMLGLGADETVIGVVARVQPQRRFDLLFDALGRLRAQHPELRMVILGRGTRFESVAAEPVRRLGLDSAVVLAGHRREDYADALAAFDWLTYLVPGSDPTCRAVLEAAAAGCPTVATRRGALPEIVVDGESGLVVDEEGGALAEAWRRLAVDAELVQRLASGARRRARHVFDPARWAREVEALYSACASSAPSEVSATSSR